ncbi:MAG TPA: carboxymuconolactone decarboxylase family protein [Candidatus Acetothermia bacterium]|nr:carboxymuconolactone decarboxylase family protein [Candidatus Acetothermia bacterium]HEX32557.1 carboxymuconolactone decarboxylase family protein [Candidatus Acetothermia bacterium]
MGDMKQAMTDVKRSLAELSKQAPEEMKCFLQFSEQVLAPDALDLKTKELIALGMALTARCKYCIGMHTQSCLAAGATVKEIWEVAAVAVMMGGGPALTYTAELLKALQEFGPKEEKVA